MSASQTRLALVLGSGGVLGGAFHAGVIKALFDVTGIDARDADLIVGTSAGSITGALIGAGLHPNDLYRREAGQPLSPAGARIMNSARAQVRGGYTGPRRSSLGAPAAPHLLWRSAVSGGLWGSRSADAVALGTALSGFAPRGSTPVEPIRSLVNGLVSDRAEGSWAWPGSPHIRICAVDLESGQRVVFEGEGSMSSGDAVSFGDAVAASCSVPSVFEPVRINGREYVDGGVHSSDNADLAGGAHYDCVVVSSPMSTQKLGQVRSPWHPMRVLTRHQTDAEVERLDASAVAVIRPGRSDLDAMGSNMLDGRRRASVALQAYNTAAAVLSRRLERTGVVSK